MFSDRIKTKYIFRIQIMSRIRILKVISRVRVRPADNAK